MSTAYLPPLDYTTVLMAAREVVMEVCETYPKQSWRNRCRIAGAMGPLELSIPVSRARGGFGKTGQVVICYRENWALKHWRAIQSAYGKAPFFPYYQDVLAPLRDDPAKAREALYKSTHDKCMKISMGDDCEQIEVWKRENSLYRFNMRLLENIFDALGLDLVISESLVFEKQPHNLIDLRNAFSPKSQQQKVSVSSWPFYTQVFSGRHGFIPGLSILDLLFHLGPDTPSYLRELSAQILLPDMGEAAN